jgi:RNA polymerase sigma-70 factor, ECF subfamily
MLGMGNDDYALIRRVLAGEKDAYGLLVADHSPGLFRIAFRITQNEADADEVVQETFLRGYRKLQDFDARSNFGTWIYRIAMNCALDVLDKRKSQTAVPIAEEYDSELPTLQVADRAAGPDRLLLSREIETRRHAAMERLTAIERVAFVMRHMEERSTEEIAGALGIAPNAAKQAVFRAVQKLRQSLAPLWVRS